VLDNTIYSEKFMEDINVLFKPELENIVTLSVRNKLGSPNERIYQKKIPKIVRRRWPDKSIVYFKDFFIY
jgi:hypothetical protein